MTIVARFAWLFLAPVLMGTTHTDRDWWRSQAGKVTEYRDDEDLACALVLKTDHARFHFIWDAKLPSHAIVERSEWNFPLNGMLIVSLRIGETWLTSSDGSRNLRALTHRHGLMFLLDQPVDDLLSRAHDLAVHTGDQTFEARLPHREVRQLVKALRRCAAQIKNVPKLGPSTR